MDSVIASMSRTASLLTSLGVRPLVMSPAQAVALVFSIMVTTGMVGCNFFPDKRHEPRFHNPFPQIQTIAILPFRNQSEDPTLSSDRVTLAYYDAAQSLPGFEVLPVGLVESQLNAFEQNVLGRSISNTEDIQRFASYLGVDAVLQGSVTDYDSYYPPRMAMKVNWYAANPGFHPIPNGYGLPWGTKAEKKISQAVRLEAERELAREQIATQTPIAAAPTGMLQPNSTQAKNLQRAPENSPNGKSSNGDTRDSPSAPKRLQENDGESPEPPIEDAQLLEASETIPPPKTAAQRQLRKQSSQSAVKLASYNAGDESLVIPNRESIESKRIEVPANMPPMPDMTPDQFGEVDAITNAMNDVPIGEFSQASTAELPTQWPDPQGFIPPPPKSTRPVASAQSEPIITHMRSYNGSDGDFTQALSDYYYFRDDGRFGGWEAYLQRSEDFIRFCCHQHMVETLAARGGELKSRTVVRWPLNRYER